MWSQSSDFPQKMLSSHLECTQSLSQGKAVNEEVEVSAPVDGRLIARIVEKGGTTELGAQIGTLLRQ